MLALGADGDRVARTAVTLELREFGPVFREHAHFSSNDWTVADAARQLVIRQRLRDRCFH